MGGGYVVGAPRLRAAILDDFGDMRSDRISEKLKVMSPTMVEITQADDGTTKRLYRLTKYGVRCAENLIARTPKPN